MDEDREHERKKLNSYIQHVYPFYEYGLWALILCKNQQMIGKIGLSNREYKGHNCVELAYLLDRNYRGKGLAKEACESCIQYAKEELYLEELYCFAEKSNLASLSLAKRLGFMILDCEEQSGKKYYVLRKKL